MTGNALKLFFERTSKNLEKESLTEVLDSFPRFKWPFLEKMIEKGCLGYVDKALAMQLLSVDGDETDAALICHLSMAARQGHICVKIEKEDIEPAPEGLWKNEDTENACLSNSDLCHLRHLLQKSTEKAASSLIFPLLEGIKSEKKENTFPYARDIQSPVIKYNNLYYLQRYWNLETSLINHFKEMMKETALIFPVNEQLIVNKLSTQLAEKKLLSEQASAILSACQSRLTIITGGPGTGKTFTAGAFLKILWEAIELEDKPRFKIALSAPTGKAAANLEASIKATIKELDHFPSLTACTLHQLLGIKRNTPERSTTVGLSADLIIIDESSMIDIAMMGRLFASVKPGARLILLGDRHQLPSVEAGSLFTDLITYLLSYPHNHAKVIELKTCLRAELKSIIDVADQVKAGNESQAFALLKSGTEGIAFIELNDELNLDLLDYAAPLFPSFSKNPEEPFELLEQFNRFRILTPLRKGPFGVDSLNKAFYKIFTEKAAGENFIAPIMVMQNDYRLNLFNGEIGLLVKNREDAHVFFASRETGKTFRKIPYLLMPRFEYAYCLSIHKSQGSEFDHVLLLLPERSESFGKEALYTGITRAKKKLEIWTKPERLSQMIHTITHRKSGVVERLALMPCFQPYIIF